MGRKSSETGLCQDLTVIYVQGSIGIGSNTLFQYASRDAVPENNDAGIISADTIGSYLQEKRISNNIGLDEVSDATGIPARILKNIEGNAREHLPSEIYLKAFYKKYSEYLGLDPEEILSAYQQNSQKKSKKGGKYNFSTVVTLKGHGDNNFVDIVRKLYVPIVVVLGCVLIYWVYNKYLVSFNPFDFFK